MHTLEKTIRTPADLIPATPPAYGAETAQVVLDIITQFPDSHHQGSWGHSATSAASRADVAAACVGGWTWMVHRTDTIGLHMSARGFAQQALGLTYDDAGRLFYECTNAHAVQALEYVAKGDPIDWQKIQPGRGSASLLAAAATLVA